ncbi:PREDICTED: RNA-directed DNA methylation 4 isoform X2 [Ipomoea nil]|uniref:RNA-directed DNA methylation 4 isoform X2 n=1 Tax=Ipomoea nil TaxID=35883 RepID=UPI000900C8C3|nr:PREDICTED: RNA-directed DNA methylation 4 isoform X2 [Ipomoea nil]
MAATEENPKDDKPVIVRVKRKASQFCLDAFWLEINERPLKRPLIDFENLSISNSSSSTSKVEELKTKKVLVQHVETITNSEVTADLVRSFVPDSAADSSIVKEKFEERRHAFKANNHMRRQDQLLTKAKQKQEDLSKNARFEQIWKSRRGKKDDEALHEVCRLYDVVRVDTEEKSHDVQEEDPELEDHRMMSQYLPLLREVMPSAAEEIESGIHDYIFKQASSDGFVYDFYAVKNDVETMAESTENHFPLVQVDDDDDFYDGPDDSDYETDDSNDENNPRNEYPDEESSGDEDGVESLSSNDRSEGESESSSDEQETDIYVSREGEDLSRFECSDGWDPFVEDDIYSGDDCELYDYGEDVW